MSEMKWGKCPEYSMIIDYDLLAIKHHLGGDFFFFKMPSILNCTYCPFSTILAGIALNLHQILRKASIPDIISLLIGSKKMADSCIKHYVFKTQIYE